MGAVSIDELFPTDIFPLLLSLLSRDPKMQKSLVQCSVVDAFADQAFKGNPALVCFVEAEEMKSDAWLQAVACEFKFPATSFLTRIPDEVDATSFPRFSLRWFSPGGDEVPLCGHATLAASHAIFTSVVPNSDVIEYRTLRGILTARRVPICPEILKTGDTQNNGSGIFLIELDFPAVPLEDYNQISAISKAMNGNSIIDVKKNAIDYLIVVLESAKAIESFEPHFDEISKCPGRGMIITAIAPPDSEYDFYSRFFFPKIGPCEDQVCGSAHCSLAVYWSDKLGKDDFVAKAASPRGGRVNLHLDRKNQRVLLRGKAVTVMKGSLLV